MEELIALLKARGLTICSCESLTAGLFAASLASVPGASGVLQGALVTYQNEIKERVAHVEADIIAAYGVISEQCAEAMALHTSDIMKADICVSFTGNAGPDAMEGKKAGLVYSSIAGPYGMKTFIFELSLKRNELREEVVRVMAQNVIQYILDGQ